MTSVPTIAELLMAGDESRWRATGFAVDAEAAVQIGTVALRIDGDADSVPGITAWTLRGAERRSDIDGLATAWTAGDPGDPAEHPNGITAIDHLVVLTSDLDRTIDALAACGLELRRIREGPAGDGTPVRQAFFRMAEVILELVAVADGPTRFWGLTFVASDLGRTLEWFGDGISEPRAAVQPGRQIATVRTRLSDSDCPSRSWTSPGSLTRAMLDHVFTDAIGALRETLESAFLERQKDVDERFQVDVLLGDVTWETSYGLPGEGFPPRVVAVITFDWPTWSQTAYRLWLQQEQIDDPPRIEIEIRLRIQRLAAHPSAEVVLGALPSQSPPIGSSAPLERFGPTVETLYRDPLEDPAYAIEVSYEGTYELTEEPLADGSILDDHFSAMGGWIASTLVRLGDLKLEFLPPDEEEVLP